VAVSELNQGEKEELERLRKGSTEVLRLRARVTSLNREVVELSAKTNRIKGLSGVHDFNDHQQSANVLESRPVFFPTGIIVPSEALSAVAEVSPVTNFSTKVEIGDAAEIYMNQKQTSLEDCLSECARLQMAGAGINIHVATTNRMANPAQAEVMRKIAGSGVGMMTVNEPEPE
jgi:hypothetical protein